MIFSTDLQNLLLEYSFGNEDGSGYRIFDNYDKWFKKSEKEGQLQTQLYKLLEEALSAKDILKLDFALLVMQAIAIDFKNDDRHFDLLFEIADLIIDDQVLGINEQNLGWLCHQLTDISFHQYDQIDQVVRRDPAYLINVIRKIGKAKYELNGYGPQMYFAAYKSIGLLWHLEQESAQSLLKEFFLIHFDPRVVEEAKEMQAHLNERK